MVEFHNVRQIEGEDRRRLFTDDDYSLYVWYHEGVISGFQLCYDKRGSEMAFMWTDAHGYAHYAVDAGEGGGLDMKRTPVFTAKATPVPADLLDRFLASSAHLEDEIVTHVGGKIRAFRSGRG